MVTRIARRPARYGWAAVLVGLASIGALLVILHPRNEHTWFVAAGAAAGGDGSAGAPFDTVQRAVDVARPGDTVRVGPGIYPGGFATVRSGTASRPIRISGAGARVVAGASPGRLIEIRHDHVDLVGFEVVGGTAGIRLYRASYVRILNNVVRDALGECIRVKNQSRHNEVAFNTIRDCGRRNFDLAADRKNGEGVYVGTAPEQLDEVPGGGPDRSDDNWIHDNTITTPAECVDVKEFSTHALVEHNTCTGGQDPDGAGLSGRGDQVTFRANTVIGGRGAGIRLGGDEQHQGVHSVVVDNALNSPDGYGVKIMREPQDAICGNGVTGAGRGASNVPGQNPVAACS